MEVHGDWETVWPASSRRLDPKTSLKKLENCPRWDWENCALKNLYDQQECVHPNLNIYWLYKRNMKCLIFYFIYSCQVEYLLSSNFKCTCWSVESWQSVYNSRRSVSSDPHWSTVRCYRKNVGRSSKSRNSNPTRIRTEGNVLWKIILCNMKILYQLLSCWLYQPEQILGYLLCKESTNGALLYNKSQMDEAIF